MLLMQAREHSWEYIWQMEIVLDVDTGTLCEGRNGSHGRADAVECLGLQMQTEELRAGLDKAEHRASSQLEAPGRSPSPRRQSSSGSPDAHEPLGTPLGGPERLFRQSSVSPAPTPPMMAGFPGAPPPSPPPTSHTPTYTNPLPHAHALRFCHGNCSQHGRVPFGTERLL